MMGLLDEWTEEPNEDDIVDTVSDEIREHR